MDAFLHKRHDVVDSPADMPGHLVRLDEAMRCGICYGIFETPMCNPQCMHTYCSLCIREALQADGRCPACKVSTDVASLRKNQALEAVAVEYKAVRAGLQNGPQNDRTNESRKRARQDADADAGSSVQSKDTGIADSASSSRDAADPADPRAVVQCPMCARKMTNLAMSSHIDTCTGAAAAAVPAAGPRRLAQLNYSTMPLKKLRDVLVEHELPTAVPAGLDRADVFRRRHQRWVLLWNANCDADVGAQRSKAQLLRDLARWESTNLAPRDRGLPDVHAHAAKYAGEFKDLVRQARESAKAGVVNGNDTANDNDTAGDTAHANDSDTVHANGTASDTANDTARANDTPHDPDIIDLSEADLVFES